MAREPVLPFRFYLITDRLHCRQAPEDWLPRLTEAGLRALQVREKDLSPAALFAFAAGLRDKVALQSRFVPNSAPPLAFYLNDRADLALSLGFTGVHLREDSLPLSQHATVLRERLSFGVSCHTLEGVLASEAAGADFATFGPIYETASKSAYGPPVGLKQLEAAAARSSLPLLALGGVTPQRAKECREAGAWGVAAISAVWDAAEPLASLTAFGEALGGL
jgi:thiamine-phosphate pyrophosphorylase